MSANRFEYAEVCPTCEQAGAKNPDTDKIFSLGYDIDEGQICCANGHAFEQIPSEASVAERDNAPLRDSATACPETLQTGTQQEIVRSGNGSGNQGEIQSETEAENQFGRHSLEDQNAPSDVSYTQLDSDALAAISKQLEAQPAKQIGMPVDAVVTNGAVLSNGDAIFAITVPERWLSAIQAEAENQNQTPSAYLQEWFDRALESEWVSSYAQTVAGSPR